MAKAKRGKGPGLSEEQKIALASIAKNLLGAMAEIGSAATDALLGRKAPDASLAIASMTNPMANREGPTEVRSVGAIRSGQTDELRHLRDEPYIARVVAADDAGRRSTYYFARSMPLSKTPKIDGVLANYRGPLGPLAELEPGDEIQLRTKGGGSHTVLERIRLRPARLEDGWDGRHDQIQTTDLTVTITSLLEFLGSFGPKPEVEDILAELEAADRAASSVQEGLRRSVIDRISLRDAAILDQYQGAVFRLPVNRRVMLSGPPGTGKTTTLIKRIAQKGRADEVSEEERELATDVDEVFHSDNWIMFTPTELLKQYLKEAFARESVAASDRRVRTWSEERRRLARDVVRILKSETGGTFTLDDDLRLLHDTSSSALIELTDAFQDHFESAVGARYRAALASLAIVEDKALARVVERIRRKVGEGPSIAIRTLSDIVEFRPDLVSHDTQLSRSTDRALHDIVNGMLARDRRLIDDLARNLNAAPEGGDDDDDELDQPQGPVDRGARPAAIRALKRALADRAKELHNPQRSRTKSGRNRQVLDFLHDRMPGDATLSPLGAALTMLEDVRFLAEAYRNLIDQVPTEYQRFRREALRSGRHFRADARGPIERRRISGLEVDVLLLTMLRNARTFIQRRGTSYQPATGIAVLDSVKGEYVTQVLVDEATDFSAVQLACMKELARPEYASFFICGDVNQRLTTWGLRDVTELRWIANDFEIREISIGYRQSGRLAALAAALASSTAATRMPPHVDDADIKPLLAEHMDAGEVGRWLAERVREVERSLGLVPSVAVFVNGDEQIDPIVKAMRPHFAERNLEVVGCKEGKVVGSDRQVRVFDVRHIKGLEFETVFFVGVDLLANQEPELFDKFLYVGATRAATYLGVTCESALPAALEHVRGHFSTGEW